MYIVILRKTTSTGDGPVEVLIEGHGGASMRVRLPREALGTVATGIGVTGMGAVQITLKRFHCCHFCCTRCSIE